MRYRLTVTSVEYHETAVYYGTIAELEAVIEDFDRMGVYKFTIWPVK